MPHRSKSPQKSASGPARRNFRSRFDELERQRAGLVTRLNTLGEVAPAHPAYRRAMTLLNDSFRKASLTQRAAVLQAAAWLIDILERVAVVS
jgi:hypothetical protein